MPPTPVHRRYAEMMARLGKMHVMFALLVWALAIGAAWGQWRVMALGALMVAITIPFNVVVNAVAAARMSAFAVEIVRAAVNLPLTLVYCHAAGWALPVWLWLPFMSLSIDPVDGRIAAVVIALFCLIMDGAALMDGVSPVVPIVFTALAIHGALIARARFSVERYMLRISDEQLVDLERALEVRKTAEARAAAMRAELVAVSRQAGMAEVASNVLHNVGNVLNSANVSSDLIAEKIRTSKLGSLARVAELLREQAGDLPRFFAEDERARHLPAFLSQLSSVLERERGQIAAELAALQKNVDHVKAIVAVQQSHAHAAGITEELHLAELIDDALSFSQVQLDDDGVTIARDYEDLPRMSVDRHKVLQILIHLLSNARDALAGATGDKTITLRLRSDAGGGALLEVSDSGSGITAENLPRIFNHGFTTKKDGHGFGLHASACAAMAMGGQLLARSDGPGRGATLTLHLASNVVQCVTTHMQAIPDFDGSLPRSMP